MAATLFTIGHGTRALDDFIRVLREQQIDELVDVRRYPGSRRNPQFARATLEETVPAHGIEYSWRGDRLGGRRQGASASRHSGLRNIAFRAYADHMDTPEFRDALSDLLDDARKRRVAVMCAETVWWRCHRRLIADAATMRGFNVVHLGMGTPQTHVVTPALRPDERGDPVYDKST